jgi:(R,R)-butanediol dehydrogenase/meso-butanediol dehydrogenase/diacetyl reductase
MKAARFNGPKDIEITDIPAPVLHPGAVMIDIAWCGICGTDLHEFLEGPIFIPAEGHPHPLTHEQEPVTMGHEFSGTIRRRRGRHRHHRRRERRGRAVLRLRRVRPCKEGRYNLCTKMGFIGLAGGGGGLSEKIVVERRWVHPVGDIPLDEAALIEPLSSATTRSCAAAPRPVTSRSSAAPGPSACCCRRCSRPKDSP